MKRILNDRMLKEAGACAVQRRLFRKLFGAKGGAVTLARAKRADKANLPIYWAVRRLFSDAQRTAYENDARVVYCTQKFMHALSFSARDQWAKKRDQAEIEAFVRVWNDATIG